MTSIQLQTLNSDGTAQADDAAPEGGVGEGANQHAEQASIPQPNTSLASASHSVGRLQSIWTVFLRERGFQVTLFSLIVAIVLMIPTFGQYSTAVWTSVKDYHEWCQDEQAKNHTLTKSCRAIVNRPIPPPPGLDRIFKDVLWRERPAVPSIPQVKREVGDGLSSLQRFFRTQTGNGVAYACLAFYNLRLRKYYPEYKSTHLHETYFLFTRIYEGSGSYTTPLLQATFLLDWIHWLHKLNIDFRASSLPAMALMPVFYALGHFNYDESFRNQIIISIISVLIAGDAYTNVFAQMYFVLSLFDGVKDPGRWHWWSLVLVYLNIYHLIDR